MWTTGLAAMMCETKASLKATSSLDPTTRIKPIPTYLHIYHANSQSQLKLQVRPGIDLKIEMNERDNIMGPHAWYLSFKDELDMHMVG